MHKIVLNAFKAVAFAIIFVIIWSVVFYLIRVFSLNSKMETIAVSMQQSVAKNNYLTSDEFDMYMRMLGNIKREMNAPASAGHDTLGDNFIVGFRINYGRECSTEYKDRLVGDMSHYVTDLEKCGNAGDIAVIELQVAFNSITWRQNGTDSGAANQIVVNDTDYDRIISYTYQVPCLRYISYTD